MLKTLQWYVSRELLKTFVLTAVGLTLTFSLTGGVFNMIQAEVLTAVQMLRLLAFVLPVAATLTLPVAAIFACAMVYGRLAADNEFDACRASGVNIVRLLAPAVGLSILTGAFTFGFTNYVLPRFIAGMEALVRKDIQKVVVQALNMQGHFKYGPFVVYAGEPPQVEERPDGSTIQIGAAAFLQVESENLMRAGTADQVLVNFWNDAKTGEPVAEAAMYDIRAFDFEQNRLYMGEEQRLDPIAVPMRTEQKTKWLDLSELVKYRQRPTELSAIRSEVEKLRMQVREAMVYKDIVRQLTTGDKVARLGDRGGRPQYEVRAATAEHDPVDYRPQLDRVRVLWRMDGHVREYESDRCNIRVGRGFGTAASVIQMRLSGKVSFTDSQHPERKRVEIPDSELEPVPVNTGIYQGEQRLSDMDLLGIGEEEIRLAASGKLPEVPPPSKLDLGPRVENTRLSTLAELAQQSLQIVGVIHSRLAFSASVLVMLVLAAALAIIIRGGQLLTAFVISFIPGMLVVVLNIAGRQLSENAGTHLVGLAIIWSGIGLVALADVVVLTKFLRR